jgi:parvulin-like peptidyl-prolyl isomerase
MKRLLILILTVALSACTPDAGAPTPLPAVTPQTDNNFEAGQPLAARVNDQPIFLAAYEKQVAQFEQAMAAQGSAAPMTQIRRQILEALIDQLLIEQQAATLGVTISDEVVEAEARANIVAQGEAQFEAWLAANNLTYDEFKRDLRGQLIANQVFAVVTASVPTSTVQIELRVIRVAELAAAQELVTQLKGGADFATLAQTHSADPFSQANGGNLGWLPQGAGLAPPEVEAVAFGLEPGQISGPIQTSLGFYIIKLEQKEAERALTPEMVQALKEQTFKVWLTRQRAEAIIERYLVL